MAAGIRAGDVIEQIGDVKDPKSFRVLQSSVVLGGDVVKFVIRREGVSEPITLSLRPDRIDDGMPMIGVIGPSSLTVTNYPGKSQAKLPMHPVWDDKVAEQLKDGDKVIAVDGHPVKTSTELKEYLTRHTQAVTLTIARKGQADKAPEQKLEVAIPPRPFKELGLVMEMAPISAVQDNSPAAEAGIQVGDVIKTVDGEPVGDPVTLPSRLAKRRPDG